MQPIEEFTKVLKIFLEDLGGDWLLVGGGLVRLEFDENRSTHDIDVAFLHHPTLSETSAFQQLYEKLIPIGLDPEHVNSAMKPYLDYVPEWKNELVPIRFGTKGRLLRPSLTLFTYLKLNRASEVDLLDIKSAFEKLRSEFDADKLNRWITEGPKSGQKRKVWQDFRSTLGLP